MLGNIVVLLCAAVAVFGPVAYWMLSSVFAFPYGTRIIFSRKILYGMLGVVFATVMSWCLLIALANQSSEPVVGANVTLGFIAMVAFILIARTTIKVYKCFDEVSSYRQPSLREIVRMTR